MGNKFGKATSAVRKNTEDRSRASTENRKNTQKRSMALKDAGKNAKKRSMALTDAGKNAKKSLGQNYIFDSALLEELADSTGIGPDARILEIGTGMGTLTEVLAHRFQKVRTVEIDSALVPVLRVSLEKYPNVDLVEGDILKMDLEKLTEDMTPFHVVANIPYYLTTELTEKLLFFRRGVLSVNMMVQKEAAERICASPGEKGYCLLSLQRAYFADAEILREVDRTAFDPVPNVDSAFIRLRMKPQPRYHDRADLEKRWLKIASAAFAMRRKTFLNNAVQAFGMSREQAAAWLSFCGIDPNRRGETFTLEETYRLAEADGFFGPARG